MLNFPDVPRNDNMHRKDRMNRLYEKLMKDGLYVEPVYTDDRAIETAFFVVALDDPHKLTVNQGQDQG